MTKLEALKKLLKKLTGVDSHETTISGVLNDLTDNYSSGTGGSLVMKTSSYTTTGETTEIPIGITGFDKDSDILLVFVNGLKLANTKFTIASDSSKITLVESLLIDQAVEFVVMKNE